MRSALTISMMRIDSVASAPDRAGRHEVRFADGTTMRLYRQTVEDFGIYPGMEMHEEVYGQLVVAAGQTSAKMRAVRIVSASSVSKKDLERRLVQKGEDPTQARQAVEWMSELNLLDDRKTAEQIVHSCISKGYGRARAKQALYEKRIPKELWDDVLADYPDQMEKIVAFLQSRIGGDADEKTIRKATDALIRRGHSYAQIRSALRMVADGCDVEEDF